MPSSCQTAVTVNDYTSNTTALSRGITLKNVRRFKELRPPSSRMSVHLNQDILLARSFELTRSTCLQDSGTVTIVHLI